MGHSLGNHRHLPNPEHLLAPLTLQGDLAFQDQEHFILVDVLVPRDRSLGKDDPSGEVAGSSHFGQGLRPLQSSSHGPEVYNFDGH